MDKNDRRKALDDAKASLHAAESAAEAARRRLEEIDAVVKREDGLTKRDIAKAAWVAPWVMSVNLPNSVFAQGAEHLGGHCAETKGVAEILMLPLAASAK